MLILPDGANFTFVDPAAVTGSGHDRKRDPRFITPRAPPVET
ncbi:hypothetical protein [Halorubrum xinjiangense]|nr:hypothetical protein [Halorubrum xinjiangense]